MNSVYKLSTRKVNLFLECPRCFYLEQKHNIKRPSYPPFLLNSAIDKLLKQEFDFYRARKQKHPIMETYNIDALPAQHPDLAKWRNSREGIRYYHEKTNFLIYGAIDDLWIDKEGRLIVVDYKATAKNEKIETNKQLWHSFLTQIEIYQWILEKKGFSVSKTGYFVYCNAKRDRQSFGAKLEFDVVVIPYLSDNSWVERTLEKIYQTIKSDQLPLSSKKCEHCHYRRLTKEIESGL